MTRKPGRPPRAAKASLERVEIRVTRAELRAWQKQAKSRGETLSDWIRGWLNLRVEDGDWRA